MSFDRVGASEGPSGDLRGRADPGCPLEPTSAPARRRQEGSPKEDKRGVRAEPTTLPVKTCWQTNAPTRHPIPEPTWPGRRKHWIGAVCCTLPQSASSAAACGVQVYGCHTSVAESNSAEDSHLLRGGSGGLQSRAVRRRSSEAVAPKGSEALNTARRAPPCSRTAVKGGEWTVDSEIQRRWDTTHLRARAISSRLAT